MLFKNRSNAERSKGLFFFFAQKSKEIVALMKMRFTLNDP